MLVSRLQHAEGWRPLQFLDLFPFLCVKELWRSLWPLRVCPETYTTAAAHINCATSFGCGLFQLMIAAVVQVSKLVWKLKTLRLSHSPTILAG